MALTMDSNSTIEKGWATINQEAIHRLESYLATNDDQLMFSKKDYMKYYT